ncbi:hypothetical protein [Streptomyces sp. NPDC017529]|uniref:hypothetical protein n=1 Tax=Streptomyces sp. NPDC017529 TaxID=3365000 RepID=UPI00378D89C5
MTYDVFIDSFGARWQDPPPPRYRAAVLSINLTDVLLNPPDDPNISDTVARQTGLDPEKSTRVCRFSTPCGAEPVRDSAACAVVCTGSESRYALLVTFDRIHLMLCGRSGVCEPVRRWAYRGGSFSSGRAARITSSARGRAACARGSSLQEVANAGYVLPSSLASAQPWKH